MSDHETDRYSLAISSAQEIDEALSPSYAGLGKLITARLSTESTGLLTQQELDAQETKDYIINGHNAMMLHDVISLFPQASSSVKVHRPIPFHGGFISSSAHVFGIEANTLDDAIWAKAHSVSVKDGHDQWIPHYVIGRSRDKKLTELLLHPAASHSRNYATLVHVHNKAIKHIDERLIKLSSTPLSQHDYAAMTLCQDRYQTGELSTYIERAESAKRPQSGKQKDLITVGSKEYSVTSISLEALNRLGTFGYLGELAAKFNVTAELIAILRKYKDLNQSIS